MVIAQDDSSFDKYEIRVILDKYMTKRNRVELAGQLTAIMNQSFIYTIMPTVLMDYHLSEMFALELEGAYGLVLDKDDKRLLKSEYDIETQILQTQYILGGSLLWTPMYGKTQLTSGHVVYFDSFATFGLGMTGVKYDYTQCSPEKNESLGSSAIVPAPTTKGYPTVILGVGQKFFLNRDLGLRWDVRTHLFQYNEADGSCTPEVQGASKLQNSITLQVGASRFF